MLNRTVDKDLFTSYSDDIPNFLKKIYASRSISEKGLSLELKNLLKPDFANLDKACVLLTQVLTKQQKILIIGDFDCDGATASVVAIKSLKMMGAKYVDFLVPNRSKHGYGLSKEIVTKAIKEKKPDLIITVDNGISSFDGAKLARKNNIKVIITDHHLPSEDLPDADVIINPNLKNCNFPSKNLAGVGVCFYLFSALKTHLNNQNFFTKNNIPLPDMRFTLDLVALGTVADVVKLDQNNRILVSSGLKRIRQKKCSVGILALLELANKKPINLKASDLGFAVAPRINAAGRLSDISRGIHCLLTNDINDAFRYAQELENFNHQRKVEQQKMQDEADKIVKEQKLDKNKFALSLFDKSWHEGIVGIVAGKLKEMHHCPCAIFARSNDILKGSIRSIPSVHIKDLLDLIARANPELILKFGGHSMAAGLSIKEKDFALFTDVFEKAVKKHLQDEMPSFELLTDGSLQVFDISLKNAQLLADAGPWGQGFEEPIFYNDFEIVEQKIVGEKHLKLSLKLEDKIFDAIAFFQEKITSKKALIAYKLSVNTWRDNNSLQLMIEQIVY